MLFGITFSPTQTEYLNINTQETFSSALQFGFHYIRLGGYWNRIEKEKGKYNFSEIDFFLTECERKGQKVVLTIGMKAPRWPEYFTPPFYKKEDNNQIIEKVVLEFVSQYVNTLGQYTCISYWQVENEPLDPSGPNGEIIPLSTLKKEIELVRKTDKRPIITTFWGNELLKRNVYPSIEHSTDIIGIDLYYKQPTTTGSFIGPQQSTISLKNFVEDSERPVWGTELQAEPWEPHTLVSEEANPKSLNPTQLELNFAEVTKINPEVVLFWGFEYWNYRKKKFNDSGLLETARKLIQT